MKFDYYVLIIFLLGSAAFSQFKTQERGYASENYFIENTNTSLLDPDRIKFDHSYSLQYSNMGNYSASLGEYVAGIAYQISQPLTMRVELAAMHDPLANLTGDYSNASKVYLKSTVIDYIPSNKMHFRIGYFDNRGSNHLSRHGKGFVNNLGDNYHSFP